ncbi:hypothetical protein CSUB01_05926 [Colletotrichum sublineola]|uniref:Uncharacterized protein n=1 Tax=Colletotrichum sublineola TaxID=1173701 RepID=A0A066XF41_COLSU|nr:hypothetical protein CSUB01_05926 [Colletotrichum sublineola]
MVCPALSLAALSLVALAAASPITIKSRQTCHGKIPNIPSKSSCSEVRELLGTNNGKPMTSKMIPGVGTKWECFNLTNVQPITTTSRPNPLDCQGLFTEWNAMGTFKLDKKAGCSTKYRRSCYTSVCALRDNVEVDASLVAARMMNPMQTTCVVNGKNGIWVNDEETVRFDENADDENNGEENVENPDEDSDENGDSDDDDDDSDDNDDSTDDDDDSDGDDEPDDEGSDDDEDSDDNDDSEDNGSDENDPDDGDDSEDNDDAVDEGSDDENSDDENIDDDSVKEDSTDEDGSDDAGSDDE